MPYRLKITETARKQYDRLPRQTQQRIQNAAVALTANPRPQGCVQLRGQQGNYRIRVGDYRILYEVDDKAQEITILKVKHRRDVYRDP